MPNTPSPSPTGRLHNRLAAILAHTIRYGFRGPSRLAADLGVPRSTVMRLLSGQSHPSVGLALGIVRLLEPEAGRTLNVGEIFSFDSTYPTASVCDLMGCPGCLPEEVYTRDGTLREEYKHLRPGRWTPGATARRDDTMQREDSS